MADNNSSILDALRGVNPQEAMPFGAGATPEGAPTALSNMAQQVIHALMAPGQALQSTTPVTSEQMVKPAADIGMLTMLGADAAPQEANSLNMGIKAYHGSPYDFDAFDLTKIGAGEGAQAYGHGLYFAENPEVARSYRPTVEPGSAADGIGLKTTGKMYEVDINADPMHFLDWDKPLSQQHPVVQQAIAEHGLAPKELDLGSFGGQPIISVPRWAGTVEESAKLRDAGIPGIKYFDQGSRALGEGSRNYVVFNDNIVKILKKYGIAGVPAAGAVVAAMPETENK